MAFEWVAGLFQSEQTRGLSGDSAHTVALDDANPYYNYRLRRHKAEGDLLERAALLWYTSPYVKRRQGLGTHVASEVGDGVANYTDVLVILSRDDFDRASEAWHEEAVRVLQGEFETYCRREGFSRLHAHRPIAFRILRDGSDEMGGQDLGLTRGEFVTGLLPNLYTGPVRGSFPVIGVNVNLPGVWEGYQEVGRLYNDQILFTLGNHWLDNFQHPSLEQAALYRLRQYPDGSFVHIVNPDLQDSYQVTTANQGGASVLTLATRGGKPLAYIVLAVIDPPSTRPSAAPIATPTPSSPPPAAPAAQRPPPVPSIAPPMLADDGDDFPLPAGSNISGLQSKTIVPDAPSERIFTLQERGAMLQKVHFSAFMLGYDVYLGKRGELGTHVDDPAATFQVRKRSVSIVAHMDGVKVGGRPVPADVEVPIEGDMGIEFAGQRFEYRDLRWVKAEGWPYVGEIRRPASSTYMIWGEEYHIGRSRECRVVLPDEPRNENIHWKPSMGDGATIRTRTKEIPKSRFYTDSIMVASEHATIDLKKESPEVVCTANHCYVYVRRGESVEPLFPSSSGRQPQVAALQPSDEVLIGNCLFHVGFTPASEAVATAPAPKVELPEPTADSLADAIAGPDVAGLDKGTPAPMASRAVPPPPPDIAPPAMFEPEDETEAPDIAPPALFDDEAMPTVQGADAAPPPLDHPPALTVPDDGWGDDEEEAVRGSALHFSEPPQGETPPPADDRFDAPPPSLPPPLPGVADPAPPPLEAGAMPEAVLAEMEEAEDEPTTPGILVPPDLDGPTYEPSDALRGVSPETTGEALYSDGDRGPDVGGWDQEDWDSPPMGVATAEESDDAPTGSAHAPVAELDEPPSSVPEPFPDLSIDAPGPVDDAAWRESAAASAADDEDASEDALACVAPGSDAPEAEASEEAYEPAEEPEAAVDFAALDTQRMRGVPPDEEEVAPTEEAPLPSEPPQAEEAPIAEAPAVAPPDAPALGAVVCMDDSEAQFELGRPLHVVQSGWMINGEVVVGNHRGADLMIPENRITPDQTFEARDYFSLKVRGRRGTLAILAPSEVLVDEQDPTEELYEDVEQLIVDVIRRDDVGEEDFAVRLQLKQDKALPDPRARLLGIDVDDPLAAALVTRGIPKGAPRTLALGDGLTVTLTFDGDTVTVSDYLAGYRQGDGFRPFFVQRGGKRFVTAPEDGVPFEVASGDRLVVDACVYVLRQE